MRFVYLVGFTAVLFVLAACSNTAQMPVASTPIPISAIPTVNPDDTVLARAQRNYNTYCAHCHGYGGEGQTDATADRTRSLGYHTVPPHDASGHTWRHPDQLLFEVVKYGINSPLNLYPMSPYESQLSDDEIFAVIDYLKRWWTDDQREWQAQLTDQFAENNPRWNPSSADDNE